MKNIELKNCPNCNERIGIHDVECPYCKYIDDPRYKKYNKKLQNNKKKNKTNKNDIYKMILLIPIVTYLIYLLIDVDKYMIIIPLILLNVMCLFVKKSMLFFDIILEIIVLLFNFINNIYHISLNKSFNELKLEIILLILGIIFIIVPKFMYLVKSKKKRRKPRKR